MSADKVMECLEFKRLALSDPNSTQQNFVEHAKECPACLKYVSSIRKMDADLKDSLNVAVPADIVAKIQLNQVISSARRFDSAWVQRPRAIAASFVAALVIAMAIFIGSGQPPVNIQQDYQQLLAAVMEHMEEVPVTEVWSADRANRSVNTLLASYDGEMQLHYMDNLQFGKICPMGQYQGLHATLDTPEGQVTFAYLRGQSVATLQDLSIVGYVSRIKPVKNGTLVIVSRNARGLEVADQQLSKAMHWTI